MSIHEVLEVCRAGAGVVDPDAGQALQVRVVLALALQAVSVLEVGELPPGVVGAVLDDDLVAAAGASVDALLIQQAGFVVGAVSAGRFAAERASQASAHMAHGSLAIRDALHEHGRAPPPQCGSGSGASGVPSG